MQKAENSTVMSTMPVRCFLVYFTTLAQRLEYIVDGRKSSVYEQRINMHALSGSEPTVSAYKRTRSTPQTAWLLGPVQFLSVAGVAQSVWCLATGRTTGRSRFDLRQRRKDFSCSLCVQTGCEAHPASCTMGTGDPLPGACR
jgi:hypothetical protein